MIGEQTDHTRSLAALRRLSTAAVGIALLHGLGISPLAALDPLVEDLHEPQAEHVDQKDLFDLVAAGALAEAFELAFDGGDELFETTFNLLDGVGAKVGEGQRFTRVPRADLTGPDEWANHFPRRETGPNAQSCTACHNQPFDDGSGDTAANVHRDPLHSGRLSDFIARNTPHLLAPGAIQRLAEEMTDELHTLRDRAIDQACGNADHVERRGGDSGRSRNPGPTVSMPLVAKGVSFGRLEVTAREGRNHCAPSIDTSRVRGVDDDLVVKPFQWKGVEASVRGFNRGASHNEIGMQPVEITGPGVDGDGDGVSDEMTIGDQTALAVYLAAQPRPTTLVELAQLGLIDPLPAQQLQAIENGEAVFRAIGCDSCHKPSMTIEAPIFSEPSQSRHYRDEVFPSGQDPLGEFVDPDFAVSFDLTQDQPDNVIEVPGGESVHLGALKTDAEGRALVELWGDLRRHYMGPQLAENIDEKGTGAAVWITKELWGVGSTAPYLHDGRATTLTEAIVLHSGEARDSRVAFQRLSTAEQADVIALLENLVIFKLAEE